MGKSNEGGAYREDMMMTRLQRSDKKLDGQTKEGKKKHFQCEINVSREVHCFEKGDILYVSPHYLQWGAPD